MLFKYFISGLPKGKKAKNPTENKLKRKYDNKYYKKRGKCPPNQGVI